MLHAEHKAKAHKHVNKALEEAMAAESAAMHSDIKKKSPVSEAKRKGIEAKMKKLQVYVYIVCMRIPIQTSCLLVGLLYSQLLRIYLMPCRCLSPLTTNTELQI